MKQSKLLKSKFVLGVVFFMLTIGLTSMQSTDFKDITGVWDYEVEAADGTMTGIMTIKKSDDTYAIEIETTQFGTLELNNIALKGKELTANIDMQGALVEFDFEFDGDSMKGTVSTPDGDLDIVAKKRK
ncbi:hypothetical protein [Polaribacter gochangensis]|uniref:hypothetical protein n=1 Tax=Polaribacter gochangensis TaxID=3252903 RepID=UPI00390482EE